MSEQVVKPDDSGQDMETTSSAPITDTDTEKPTPTPTIPPSEATVVTKDKDDSRYPSGLPLFLIFLSLYTTTFLVALDGTVIATAIPTITNE